MSVRVSYKEANNMYRINKFEVLNKHQILVKENMHHGKHVKARKS